MPLIFPSNTLSGGYTVDNSCRFNDGDSPHMEKTYGTSTDVDKCTISVWVKRGALGGTKSIFGFHTDDNNRGSLVFEADQLDLIIRDSGSVTTRLVTTQVFRDVSAWLNIVLSVDTGQGTASSRVRLYVNGSEITDFGTETNPSQDLNFGLNNSSIVGKVGQKGENNDYFDGYMAEFVFIDGLQLTPSSFGEFDEDSPTIWKPKDVSGLTFGTNGFYLDFEDSGDLGDDESGNGNDFTETNLAATDQTTDTPTNNFCTFNPLYFRPGRTATTFSEGNCKSVHSDTGGTTPAWGTIALHHGKWYFEMKVIEEYAMYIGIWQTQGAWTNPGLYDGLSGVNTYRPWDGQTNDENVGLASYGDTYADDDIIGCAFDCDTGTIWFSKNGTWQNSATQAEVVAGTTTNAAFTGKAYSTNGVIPICTAYSPSPSSGASVEANFGNPSFTISSGNADDNGYGNFEYDVPTGYYAICTKNLAEFG